MLNCSNELDTKLCPTSRSHSESMGERLGQPEWSLNGLVPKEPGLGLSLKSPGLLMLSHHSQPCLHDLPELIEKRLVNRVLVAAAAPCRGQSTPASKH